MIVGDSMPHGATLRVLFGCQPKNRGILPPKWMVKIMETPIKMDDLGGTTILGNTHLYINAWHLFANFFFHI